MREKIYYKIITLIILIGIVGNLNAQTIGTINPTPKTPEVATFKQPKIINNYNGINQPKTPNVYNPNLSTKQRNHILIQQANQQIKQNQIQGRQLVKEAISEFNNRPTINYNLPSYSKIPETSHYRKAFTSLTKMIDTSYSIKKANFIVENAFFENKGDFGEFDNLIGQIGQFLNDKMDELKYDKSNNLHKNTILFQFFSDTLKIKSKNMEHLPFKYEFDDYMGRSDWTNMFVSKLLKTNKGQCHSLPLLYLILAEEIGAKAYLSFSPNHSYIKFQNNNGKWINVELTNGMLTMDAFILQSGYIKAEALSNKIYMQPLTEKQVLSQMMVDLAKGYSVKFGYDEFVEQVLEKALTIYPNNIFAQMMKSDLKTLQFMSVQKQLNVPPNEIHKYPKAKQMLDAMYQQYEIIDNLGYEEMPLENYEKWLNSLNRAKEKQENQKIQEKINQTIKLDKSIKIKQWKD